jgi:Fe-S-cluster containining protein
VHLGYASAMACHSLPARDQELVQIVNAAFQDSAQRSGKWLACKPGCSQCCVGVFSINQLDAARLRQGLDDLEAKDPERAGRIRQRARDTVARLAPDYPGDPKTGVLDDSDSEEASKRWDDFANDVPCPVLNPETGTCELYEARPLLCRTFGPPVQSDEDENDLIVCDLCFEGASDEEVQACQMRPDPNNLEPVLLEEYEKNTGATGDTIIAFAIGLK